MVTAKEPGALFLTIPYDESWTATVDGVAAEVHPIDDAFMAIELSAGTHTVELTYHPTKFSLCVLISVASVIALVFLTIIRKIRESVAMKKRLAAAGAVDVEMDVSDETDSDVEEKETPADVTDDVPADDAKTSEEGSETAEEAAPKTDETPEDNAVSPEGSEEA